MDRKKLFSFFCFLGVPRPPQGHLTSKMVKDPPLKDGLEETRKLAQYWKSRLRITPQAIWKRLKQEGKPGEYERVVAKKRPARNLVSMTPDRSPTPLSSSSSQSPRNLTEK